MKKRKIIFYLLFSGALVVLGIKIYDINMRYPSPKVQIYEVDSKINTNKNRVSFEVTSFDLLSKKRVETAVPEFYKDFTQEFSDFIGITVSVNIKNHTEKPESFELYEALLTMNNTYSNGINFPGTLELNSLNSLAVFQELAPVSSQEITLFFVIIKENISKKNWQKIDKQEFFLTFKLYPTIEKVKLQ